MKYRTLQYNPQTKKIRRGTTDLPESLTSQESYFLKEGSTYKLLSKFGTTEYTCSGTCFCTDEERTEGRRLASSTSKSLAKGLFFLVAAFSSSIAVERAQKYFDDMCASDFSPENCPNDYKNILSEVWDCDEVDDGVGIPTDEYDFITPPDLDNMDDDGIYDLPERGTWPRRARHEYAEYDESYGIWDCTGHCLRKTIDATTRDYTAYIKEKFLEVNKRRYEKEKKKGRKKKVSPKLYQKRKARGFFQYESFSKKHERDGMKISQKQKSIDFDEQSYRKIPLLMSKYRKRLKKEDCRFKEMFKYFIVHGGTREMINQDLMQYSDAILDLQLSEFTPPKYMGLFPYVDYTELEDKEKIEIIFIRKYLDPFCSTFVFDELEEFVNDGGWKYFDGPIPDGKLCTGFDEKQTLKIGIFANPTVECEKIEPEKSLLQKNMKKKITKKIQKKKNRAL